MNFLVFIIILYIFFFNILMMNNKINSYIIYHRTGHHARYSGYSQLINYIDSKVITGKKNIIPYKFSKFISKFISRSSGIYNTSSIEKEIEIIFERFKNFNKLNLFHFLNGERDIRFSTLFKGSSKIIATFHKPPDILQELIKNKKYLKKLDGAIVVGKSQFEYIKKEFGIKNVKYIPHGVDTDFFIPDINKKENNTLLFVGQHLRDFDALNYSIPKLIEKFPDLKVNIVIQEAYTKYINKLDCINFYSGINDENLRDLYQKATYLFLPLKDVTACNSILEAIACGLPVITTDLESNREYLDIDYTFFHMNEDYDDLIQKTIEALNDEKYNTKTLRARESSLKYDWKKIAIEIEDFYKIIMS